MSSPIRLKEIRETTGLSQKAFAEYLHIPIRTYEQWEAGKRNPPSYLVDLIEYKIRSEDISQR